MIRYLFAAALCCAPLLAHAETCIASQYGVGDGYHGRRAAGGSICNSYALPAAHKASPSPTWLTAGAS
jgi:rare lipoprotein A